LGIIRANPNDYVKKYGDTLKNVNDFKHYLNEIETHASYQNLTSADLNSDSKVPYELEGAIEALERVDLAKEGLSEYKEYLFEYLKAKKFLSKNTKTNKVEEAKSPVLINFPSESNQQSSVSKENSIQQENVSKEFKNEKSFSSEMSIIYNNKTNNNSSEFWDTLGWNDQTQSIHEVTIPSLEDDLNRLIEQIFELIDKKGKGCISYAQAESFFLKLNNDLNGEKEDKRNILEYFQSLKKTPRQQLDLNDFKKVFLEIKCNEIS
jgi:hypothetical protein